MKKIKRIEILFILALFVACSGADQNESLPSDIGAIHKEKTKLRKQIRNIEGQLKKLDSMLALLDPSSVEIDYHYVTIDTVRSQTLKRFVDVQASVASDKEIMASSEVPGRLIQLIPREGQYIRRGALLAKIDMQSLQKQREEIKTALDLAIELYQKQKRLWDKQIGSEIQYLQAKNAVERLEKNMAALDHQLTKQNIYAPISGVVDQLFAETGEVVGPGMPIAKIINMNQLKIVADVSERYIRSVRKGDQVLVEIPALDIEKTLRIGRVGSTIHPANRTFSVEVPISNKNNMLKPNLLARIKIKDKHLDDVIVIPTHVVHEAPNGEKFVYLAQQDNDKIIAVKRQITLGEYNEDRVVVPSGLKEGDLLIVKGAQQMSENNFLKIVSDPK